MVMYIVEFWFSSIKTTRIPAIRIAIEVQMEIDRMKNLLVESMKEIADITKMIKTVNSTQKLLVQK